MSRSDAAKPYRIFISRVTGEFGNASEELASDLRKKGMIGRIQIDFRQEEDTATTLDNLEKDVRLSDAVIALIGVQSGSYPPDDAANKWPHVLPDGITRATYTQWEIHFARKYGKRLSFYFGFKENAGTILYPPEKASDPAKDDPPGQLAYARWLTGTLGLNRQYFESVHQLCRQVLTESWPEFPRLRPVHLPFATIGDLFIGREDFLANIRRGLDEARAAGRHDPNHVIWGLGGIGKTRAVLEYAWQHEEDYSALLFVSGETPDKLTESIAALSGILGIACEDGTPTDARYAAAIEWLRANKGWLLIIDNVDDPAAVAAVEARLASLSAGHVIITARLGAWKKDVIPLELHLLTSEAAVRYLLAATHGQRAPTATPDKDREDAAALARDVDHLALALETTAAYIAQQHISFAAYRATLAAQPVSVLDFLDPATTDYPRSVARTWLITMDRLPDDARQLLRVLSWFAPDPIPRFLLSYDPETKAKCDETANLALLKVLENYAFVHWDAAFTSFTLHRLVQEIMRQQQTCPVPPPALITSLTWINGAFPKGASDVHTWLIAGPLAPHAHAVGAYADQHTIPHPTARLFCELALLYRTKAQYQSAESLMRRAVELYENRGGTLHADYATAINNLAGLLSHMSRLAEAEPLMRRALAIDEAALGKDHPNVSRNLNNLAMLLKDTNRLAEAEPLMLRALSIDESSFGKAHPEVAVSLNNLASVYYATNRLAEAEPLMRRALAINEASLGKDHPKVAVHLNNLAQLLQARNRRAEAEPLLRRALGIDESSFGKDHPEVAAGLNNLAQLLQASNRPAEAEPLMRRALDIDEASFGNDHPNVATDLNNLAQLLKATNRLAEATPLMRRHLEIFVAFTVATGHSHPQLKAAINNYSILLKEMGDTDEQAREKLDKILEPIRRK